VLHADTNYRSPRDILEHLNKLLTFDRPIAAGCPIGGSEIEFLTYADAAGLLAETRRAIGQASTRDMQRAFSRYGPPTPAPTTPRLAEMRLEVDPLARDDTSSGIISSG
jgi:hypothetical protein